MKMVRVQLVAVCGAEREQNLYRCGNRECAQSQPAPRLRRRKCGRAADQMPLSRGIARRIIERITRSQHESFDDAEAEHDLADDERRECATRHENSALTEFIV